MDGLLLPSGFPKLGVPQNGWFIIKGKYENPKMDD